MSFLVLFLKSSIISGIRYFLYSFNVSKYNALTDELAKYREQIKGLHIWGKKKSASGRWVAHTGTLDTYFNNNAESKNAFLKGIMKVCADDKIRFLVPEVNSGVSDLVSIVNDIFCYGEM